MGRLNCGVFGLFPVKILFAFTFYSIVGLKPQNSWIAPSKYIGDDIEKDYRGAKNIKWHGLVIKRDQNHDNSLVSSPRYICNSFDEVYYVMQTPGLLLPRAF